jgi:hypothetical protein
MKYWWNYTASGNQSSPRKVCPSITLSTTNFTWYRNQGQAFESQFATKQTSPRWLWSLLFPAMWSRVVRQTITDVLGWTTASVFRAGRKSRVGKASHIRMGGSYSTESFFARIIPLLWRRKQGIPPQRYYLPTILRRTPQLKLWNV